MGEWQGSSSWQLLAPGAACTHLQPLQPRGPLDPWESWFSLGHRETLASSSHGRAGIGVTLPAAVPGEVRGTHGFAWLSDAWRPLVPFGSGLSWDPNHIRELALETGAGIAGVSLQGGSTQRDGARRHPPTCMDREHWGLELAAHHFRDCGCLSLPGAGLPGPSESSMEQIWERHPWHHDGRERMLWGEGKGSQLLQGVKGPLQRSSGRLGIWGTGGSPCGKGMPWHCSDARPCKDRRLRWLLRPLLGPAESPAGASRHSPFHP